MHDEAVLRLKPAPTSGRTLAIAPAMTYEEFRHKAWTASQEIGREGRGVIAVHELRRALGEIPPASFNTHLLRLERNGLVYLIPPDSLESLTDEARRGALPHPAGDLRAFLLWMGPKTRPAYFWD
jgi:hypothetical protein